MRIYAERLVEQLDKSLKPVYLIFGNEPLFVQESRLAIQKAALRQGFEERHRFAVDASLNWNEVYDCFQALSLFSSRQIVELELPEAGVNAAIASELLTLSSMLHPDTLLVVIGSKLNKAQENAKWFKTLTQHGHWVSCQTPDMARLPQFVQGRCRQLGLKPDQQAVQMLAQWHEGNLFALVQSLEKLALLYPDGVLNLVRLEESLSRHNHFTPFHWIDALLEGKANRCQKILRQLAAEGVESVILLRSLQKELMLLLKMQALSAQLPLNAIFEQHKVWSNKKPLYHAALTRLTRQHLQRLLHILTQAELLAKTQYEQSEWPLLHQLSLEMCLPNAELACKA